MGSKYLVQALSYDRDLDAEYADCVYDVCKQTDWLIVALFWFVVWSVEYDGCDIIKRS